MADRKTFKLRSLDDVNEAQEWLFNEQRDGAMDTKRADGMNTTLKGCQGLLKLRMEAWKLWVTMQTKKLGKVPRSLIPPGLDVDGE